MVRINQNEEEIRIVIELNRLVARRPDIVLLPTYLKFNCPPIFFERHLTQEIDEDASFCRILKNEARLVLIKKEKGIWPEMFLQLSKDELQQKRIEMSDRLISRNKERDEKAIERYDKKKRAEIEKEVSRETAMRDRAKQFQKEAVEEMMKSEEKLCAERKETVQESSKTKAIQGRIQSAPPVGSSTTPIPRVATRSSLPAQAPMVPLRSRGKINVCFSNFAYVTPKRESQEGKPRPFLFEDKEELKEKLEQAFLGE